ncbi:MAG: hypothetical protein NTZ83_00970, partial [Candidatus Pacearchaeota archaeon]|nr:hypothetical protein [Candidatus Pacearchaeota archaeon]
ITTNAHETSIYIRWEGIILLVCLILFAFTLSLFFGILQTWLQKKFEGKTKILIIIIIVILILLLIAIILLDGSGQLINIIKDSG